MVWVNFYDSIESNDSQSSNLPMYDSRRPKPSDEPDPANVNGKSFMVRYTNFNYIYFGIAFML